MGGDLGLGGPYPEIFLAKFQNHLIKPKFSFFHPKFLPTFFSYLIVSNVLLLCLKYNDIPSELIII